LFAIGYPLIESCFLLHGRLSRCRRRNIIRRIEGSRRKMIEELQREVVGLDKEKYEIVVIRIGMKHLS